MFQYKYRVGFDKDISNDGLAASTINKQKNGWLKANRFV